MVLSQVKSLAIPVLVAVGVLTTGTSVIAYQFFGRAPGRQAGQIAREKAPRPEAVTSLPPADQANQSDLQTARTTLENLRKLYSRGTEGLIIDVAQYNNWSLNLLFGEMLADPSDAGRAKAFEGHRDRLAALLKDLSPQSEGGKVAKKVTIDLRGYLERAERMLAQARNWTGGPNAGMMATMMGRGMGGMGMMGQMMRGRMSGQMGGTPGGMGEQDGKMEGGAIDDGSDSRIEIARMAATISTLDQSPANQALQARLDEPVTLHFPNPTPLSEVMKHIRSSLKGPDGKKLPIYVDPEGLEEAEKSLESPVTIDLEDIPLRFSLRLMLKPLGLAYCVREGVLIISSVQGVKQELKEAESEQQILQQFRRSQ